MKLSFVALVLATLLYVVNCAEQRYNFIAQYAKCPAHQKVNQILRFRILGAENIAAVQRRRLSVKVRKCKQGSTLLARRTYYVRLIQKLLRAEHKLETVRIVRNNEKVLDVQMALRCCCTKRYPWYSLCGMKCNYERELDISANSAKVTLVSPKRKNGKGRALVKVTSNSNVQLYLLDSKGRKMTPRRRLLTQDRSGFC